MQEKRTENSMTKLARFIVDKRKAFYLVFLAAFIFCAASVSKVRINNDITSYLPAQTETRRGLTIMEEEFITLGSANVMVANITVETARELADRLTQIPGVSEVVFDDTPEHYPNASALSSVSFDTPETDPKAIAAVASGAIEVKRIVTHRFELDHIQEAFDEAVNNKTDLVKAVIKI